MLASQRAGGARAARTTCGQTPPVRPLRGSIPLGLPIDCSPNVGALREPRPPSPDTYAAPVAEGLSPALSPLLRLAQEAHCRAEESLPVCFLKSLNL